MTTPAYYRNKELSNNCSMYEPCPMCFKCMVKASHLYVRCVECPVQFCAHDNKKRNWAIRRENFAITVSPETEAKIKEWAERGYCTCNEKKEEN